MTYVRLSVTDRCNFRCTYCMPAEGIEHIPRPELLTYEELTTVATVFARLGVESIRLTGGEPLVRADIPSLVSRLKAIPGIRRVALTTNAFLLARHAKALAEAGLDDVNISLDSLDPDIFQRISRVGDLTKVIEGIDAARTAGIERIKLNAVVMGGVNDHELVDLVRFASERSAVMRFIEFMPIGTDTAWDGRATCVSAAEMRRRLAEVWDVERDDRTFGSGPARYLRLRDRESGAVTTVGIISAVTECFCADCNRVRVTPQGGLRACLADDREIDLRVPLRTLEAPAERLSEVERLIRMSLFGKRESHTFDIDGDAVTTTRMHSIGG